MSKEQDQDNARRARAREVGLFRYGLIQDALDEALSTKQRGRLVRAVAARTHPGPFGSPVRVSRATLDRWIRGYRTGGFAALVPAPRRVQPVTPAHVLELAVALKPNVRWVGDALHGPQVAGRKAILIAFLDDHARAVVAARWGYAENAVALRETLKVGLASRGRPAQVYVDYADLRVMPTSARMALQGRGSAPARSA